jgi:[acyl-carrier-protein] S-malonyltransferase
MWQASIETMRKAGAAVFVELGAGRVLVGLLRRIDRHLASVGVRDVESLDKTIDFFKAEGYFGS